MNKRILIKDGKALIDESGNVLVAENIGVEGATIKTAATWQGTAVESGNVENVYLNTNLSVEEVVNIVSSINIDEIYFSVAKTDESYGLGIMYYNNMCAILDLVSNEIYFHNVVEEGAESELGFPAGWNPNITMPIAINSEVEVGEENAKLTSLISTTPFTYQEGTPIELSGKYEETTITITEKGTQNLINLIVNDKKMPTKIMGAFHDNKDFLIDRTFITEFVDGKVTSLNDYACAGCLNLSNVDLPNLNAVSESAFAYSGLSTVNLPNVAYVYTRAFYRISQLTSIELQSAKTIGESAFQFCYGLQSVNLPIAETIGDNAFANSGLTSVYFPEVTQVGYEGFQGCDSLETLSLPKCTTFGGSEFNKYYGYCLNSCGVLKTVDLPKVSLILQYTFFGCKSLVNVNIPIATIIREYAFSYCSSLKTLNLPKVNRIENNAFRECTELTDLYLGYDGVASLDINAFNDAGTTQGYINVHVKSAYADQYASAPNWSNLITDGKIKIVGDYTD